MKEETIDNNPSFSAEDKNHPTLLNWTSIILLWCGTAYCVANGLTSDPKVIAGITLLALSTATTYFKPETGVKLTLGIILLGIVGLLTFSPFSYAVGIGIGNFKPSIQTLPLAVGIIHYFTNRRVLAPFIKSILSREVSKEDALAVESGKIDGFKKRYARKSAAELRVMAENKGLLPEARKAAVELLAERR